MYRIAHALDKFDISDTDKECILNGMKILSSQMSSYPSNIWECIGSGAFKECYIWDNIAVKFATENNYTMDTEAKAYDVIQKEGISKLFAKTIFLPIIRDWNIKATYVDNDQNYTYNSYEHNYDVKDPFFDCLIFQEKVDKIYGEIKRPILADSIITFNLQNNAKEQIQNYENNPLFDEFNNIVCIEQAKLLDKVFCYHKWTQDAIISYGLEFMIKAAKICIDLRIRDLHSNNIGYRADGTPVIFDFLS